jgi:hypothetical protein
LIKLWTKIGVTYQKKPGPSAHPAPNCVAVCSVSLNTAAAVKRCTPYLLPEITRAGQFLSLHLNLVPITQWSLQPSGRCAPVDLAYFKSLNCLRRRNFEPPAGLALSQQDGAERQGWRRSPVFFHGSIAGRHVARIGGGGNIQGLETS